MKQHESMLMMSQPQLCICMHHIPLLFHSIEFLSLNCAYACITYHYHFTALNFSASTVHMHASHTTTISQHWISQPPQCNVHRQCLHFLRALSHGVQRRFSFELCKQCPHLHHASPQTVLTMFQAWLRDRTLVCQRSAVTDEASEHDGWMLSAWKACSGDSKDLALGWSMKATTFAMTATNHEGYSDLRFSRQCLG
jgi:hypothetical protein